jgi:ureidoglycolate lyase
MKLLRYADGRGNTIGAIKGDDAVINLRKHWPDLRHDLTALIETWPKIGSGLASLVADSVPDAALAEVRLLAPIARPGKILAIGLKWRSHQGDWSTTVPSSDVVHQSGHFYKFPLRSDRAADGVGAGRLRS